MICFTEVQFSQTYSPLRWSQRPGLFQPFPSLKRSLGPSELLLLNQTGTNFPARTTTQLVSLALVTIELFARKNERKKQSKRKSSKEHNKSLSLITKALYGIGRGFDHFGVSCIECLALVSSWKVENLDDLNVGWLGVFITLLGPCFVAEGPAGRNSFGKSCLYVMSKLPLMKLRCYSVSEDEGSNRLKDGMTF
jgi:hypothetical protein